MNIVKKLVFSSFFIACTYIAHGFSLSKDLKPQWLVYENDQYVPFTKDHNDNTTIYFWLDGEDAKAERLVIKTRETAYVFINGALASKGQTFSFSVDSLSSAFASASMLVAIKLSEGHFDNISTHLVNPSPVMDASLNVERKSSSFRDFGIIGIIILISMLVLIVRINPKLASDYFSFKKIFSTRESDESQGYSRITSSTNILFYLYCSLMLSYYLIIIFHFIPSHYAVAFSFHADTFAMALLEWMRLTGIILVLFIIKIIIVFGISFLFNLQSVAGIHFFNWVRLLLVVFGSFTILLFLYFVTHGQNENLWIGFLQLLGWAIGVWLFLIFYKLSSKMNHSMFHLFSYICATELLPFLITIKVLYN